MAASQVNQVRGKKGDPAAAATKLWLRMRREPPNFSRSSASSESEEHGRAEERGGGEEHVTESEGEGNGDGRRAARSERE